MTGGAWSCPHELNGHCGKVKNLPCDPGMKGCELYGRYVFFDSRGQKTEDGGQSVTGCAAPANISVLRK
ncbi:MAG: hypothetical protein LBS49_05870 [Candidatus Accumulibacter sp.]|nr:hypothetical protein [Accumulibacter sp.]MDR1935094.1 hypothetical protein [Accumulibacter sp.]